MPTVRATVLIELFSEAGDEMTTERALELLPLEIEDCLWRGLSVYDTDGRWLMTSKASVKAIELVDGA